MAAARAHAALESRDYVIPDDVAGLATVVLAHRVLPSVDAQLARKDATSIVKALVSQVAVPARR